MNYLDVLGFQDVQQTIRHTKARYVSHFKPVIDISNINSRGIADSKLVIPGDNTSALVQSIKRAFDSMAIFTSRGITNMDTRPETRNADDDGVDHADWE